MRAANVMDDEDLQWLLKERERAKSNRDAQERSERTEAGEEVNAEASSARERWLGVTLLMICCVQCLFD